MQKSEFIQKIDLQYDLEEVRYQCDEILQEYPFNEDFQVCLNYPPGEEDEELLPYIGTGDLRAPMTSRYKIHEAKFTDFVPQFKGTIFEEIWFSLKEKKYQLGRMRLSLLPPKRAMTMHIDPAMYRIHLPIYTNPHSYMYSEKRGAFHLEATGGAYKMDGEMLHTAFNAGRTDRVHLLISQFK